MTRILYYTDGSSATSFSGSSPLSFGTAQPRVTARTALYDALTAGLTAMGWTQYNQGTRNDVWTSTGESGNESINIQVNYDGSRFFYFYVGTKISSSNTLLGAIGGGSTNTYETWDLGLSDFTIDYIISGTKDYFVFFITAATAGSGISVGVVFSAILGNVERNATINANTLITNASVSAGSLVSVNVSSNPITAGYVPGDTVQIVSQAAADAAQAQTVRVVGITTSSLIVDSVAVSYSSGARIGAFPLPIFRFVTKGGSPLDATWTYSPLSFTYTGATSDIVAEPGTALTGIEYSAGITNTAQDGFGFSTLANKRTRRFTMRSVEIKLPNEAVLGRIPGVYVLPNGNYTHNPNSTVSWNRASGGVTQNFIVCLFGSYYWAVGKSP